MQRNDFVSNSSSCSFVVLTPQMWYDGYLKQHSDKSILQELKKFYGQFHIFCFDKRKADTEQKRMMLMNLENAVNSNELLIQQFKKGLTMEFITYIKKYNPTEYEMIQKDEHKYFEETFKNYLFFWCVDNAEVVNTFDVVFPKDMDEIMVRDFLSLMMFCGKSLGEWEDLPPELYCWLKYNNVSYEFLTYTR